MKKLYYLIFAISTLLLTACDRGEKLVYQKYIFPYRTVVDQLEGTCADDWSDNLRFYINDREAEWLNKRVKLSKEEEAKWSEEIHNKELASYIVEDATQYNRIKQVIDRMKPYLKDKRFSIQHYVVNMPVYNAFSIVGGRVYFTQTLLNEVNDEELAFIIGHELGHLENHHSVEKIKLYKGGGLLGALFFNVLFSGANQKSELEADYSGAYLTFKAGYSPSAGVSLFDRWASKQEEKKSVIGEFFRSHPYSDARAGCLNAYLNRAEQEAQANPSKIILTPLPLLIWEQYKTFISLSIFGILVLPILVFAFFKKKQWPILLLGYLLLFATLFLISKQSINYCYGEAYTNIKDKKHPEPVNIRSSAQLLKDKSNVADQIPHDELVTIYFAGPKDLIDGAEGRWCLVSRGDVNGWVWGEKLRVK
jgi:beta-barrel assembly-enhancing protease